MTPIKLTVNPLGTNCYILPTEKNNAVIIDPAGDSDVIIAALEKNSLTPTALLLTHGHFDHTGACFDIINKYGVRLYIHKNDEIMLTDSQRALAFFAPQMPYYPLKADAFVYDGETLVFDNLTIKVLHTPGHTKGSVCYFCENMLFSGDTLFNGSVGRTDCFGGDITEQSQSLELLRNITENYQLFAGHGSDSTLDYEKICNPYFSPAFFGGIFL